MRLTLAQRLELERRELLADLCRRGVSAEEREGWAVALRAMARRRVLSAAWVRRVGRSRDASECPMDVLR